MPDFCGTPCPITVGRHAHLLRDALPFETGCLSLFDENGSAVGSFPLDMTRMQLFWKLFFFSSSGNLGLNWKVDMSASNSTPHGLQGKMT